MLRIPILCLLILFVFGAGDRLMAQITKEFQVEERTGYHLVNLDFNVYKGVSDIQRRQGDQPIHIFSNLSKVNILPSFSHEIKDHELSAHLTHRNVESENLGKSLSHKLFASDSEDFDHHWVVSLSSNYLYNLHFNFGIGKANLDLSYIPVSNCKVKTASADVKLDYSKKIANSVNMDTMMVSINMGSLEGNNINFSNAKEMLFEINYGTINLTFSDPMPDASNIQALVGAGKVNLNLLDSDQPYKIKIKSTPMCRTYIAKHLKDIGDKTYVSKNYRADAKNLMTFTIDVSVGSVTIK